jgi:hypothetical protein
MAETLRASEPVPKKSVPSEKPELRKSKRKEKKPKYAYV